MIKNIVFDLGGVVLPLTPEEAWKRFEALGIKNARKQMGLYGQTGIFLSVENGDMSVEQFLKELNLQARQQANEGETVEPIDYKRAQWAWKGYLDNVELFRLKNLLTLKQKYNILLLSNINPFVVDWASQNDFSGDGHPIGFYFDDMFLSYKMHDYKPADSIFRKLLAQAGILPEETLFLDDGENNVITAQKLGFNVLHVRENEDWMPELNKVLELLNK